MQDEKPISSQRLFLVREALSLNPTAFSALLGVPRTSLLGWEAGKSVPVETVGRLVKACNVSPDWFLSGDGSMFRDLRTQSPSTSASSSGALASTEFSMVQFRRGVPMELDSDENDPNGVVLLPLFNQRSAAGPGQEVLETAEVETLVPVVREILGHRNPRDCGVVRVVGDSMAEIQLNNGDRAIFDRGDQDGDGVFVITHNGAVRIKRLQYRFDVKKVFIKSENKRYPDVEEEPIEAIGTVLKIEGKVIGWLHRHLY